jgi:hypothetical protein
MLGGGSMYWAEANGTTNWSNDDTAAWPAMTLLVDDMVDPLEGGGDIPINAGSIYLRRGR